MWRREVMWMLVFLLLPTMVRADAITDYNLVVTFYKQQKWKLAGETAEDFIKKYPTHEKAPLARLYWGQALVHLQDFNTARNEFRLFVKSSPEHPDRPLGMYRIGECSYFLNDFTSAEQELILFLNQNPKHELTEWGYLYLGETQFRLNKFAESAKTFDQYRTAFPAGRLIDDVEFGLARAEEALGNSAKAIELYQNVANRTSSPRAPEAQFNIGSRYFDEKQYQQAATAFETVAQKFAEHALAPLAFLNAGYARYYLQEYQPAIALFEQASKDPQQQETARYWVGLSQKSIGEFEAASNTFETSLREKPQQTLAENLYFQWGDAELRKRDFKRAIQIFNQTVEKWPQGDFADDALHSACEAAFQLQDYKLAEQIHQKFQQDYATSGLRLLQDLLYGRLLVAEGDALEDKSEALKKFELAATLLKEVAEKSTVDLTSNEARYQLARSYERMEKDAEVVATLEVLLTRQELMTPQAIQDSLLLQANSLLRLKEYPKAIISYQKFIDSAGSPEEKLQGLAGIASAQIATQDWESLKQSLTELASSDPADTQLSRIAVAAGDAAFDAGLWVPSAEFFQQVVKLGEAGRYYIVALSGLGHAQYEQAQFKAAAESFEQLTKINVEDKVLLSHAVYMVGLSQRRAEQIETALVWYQRGAKDFSIANKEAPTETDLKIGLNAYRSAKGGARTAREVDKTELADQLYSAAYGELKKQPLAEQTELDLLINEWADLSYNAENYARSDELYALLVKERPESDLADDAQLILTESLRYQGNLEEALAKFQQLAEANTSDDFVKQRSLVHLLDLAAEKSDWQSVLSSAEKLEEAFPNNNHQTYIKYRMGEAQLQSKNYPKAIEILEALKVELSADLLNAPPWWPEAWLLLGEALFRTKNYSELDKVVAELKEKAAASPLIYRADALVGQSFESQAKFEEAREAYLRVVDSKDGNGTETAAECQFRIAESYLKQKNYQTAYKEYYKVYAGYESETYEPAALYQAGRCDSSLKNWRGAVLSYKTLIDEFPNSEYVEKAEQEIAEIQKAFPELKETLQ